MSDSNNKDYSEYGEMDGKTGTLVLNIMGIALGALFISPIILGILRWKS